MDGSSNAWTEEDWAFNLNGISAVELPAANMSVSGSLEQSSQHMWPTAPDLMQQYNPYALSDTNIDPASIGSHPQDDWSISLGLPTHDPLYLMGGISPQPMPTNLSSSFGQVIPTFPQDFADQVFSMNISSVDSNVLSDERIGTPYSVAIEASSSSNSPGSRPSLERGGQPTPNSSVSLEQDQNVHNNLQVPAKQRRTRARARTKQTIHCSFSSCPRTFKRMCDLRKHENRHTRPCKCPILDCLEDGADQKAIHRHLWTAHKVYALKNNIPCEWEICPFEGCGMIARADNLKRHIRKKH